MSKRRIHKWTDEEREYLFSIVKGRSYREILKLMNEKFDYEFSLSQIDAAICRYKLNTGRTGRFEKNHTPWNKGVKGWVGPNKTSFKKGTVPPNYKPVGTERIDADGYTYVKIKDPNKWELKHRYIYKQHHGEIPKNYNVIFADRNPQNFDIDNLILVSKSEMLILNNNKLIFEDKELTQVGVNIAKVIDKAKKRVK